VSSSRDFFIIFFYSVYNVGSAVALVATMNFHCVVVVVVDAAALMNMVISVVLTDENVAFWTSVFDRLHRVDAAWDQATWPASYDAEDESEDPGGCAGIR